MGLIGCPETSLRNYHHSLLNTHMSADLIYCMAEACNHT